MLYGEARKIPARSVTARLLMRNNKLPYYDITETEAQEDRQAIIQYAFHKMVKNLVEKLGPYGETWELGRARGTDIKHLLSVKGLGRTGLYTGGGVGIVNATKKTHGPSWRMVVELGDSVTANGVFPGGQSGNPGSPYYDNSVDKWVKGEYYNLHFLKQASDATDANLKLTKLRNFQ